MTQNVISWGEWHTSSAIEQSCPQGCGRHTIHEADDLNQATSVRRKAGLRIAHERWLKDGSSQASRNGSREARQRQAQESRDAKEGREENDFARGVNRERVHTA